MQSSGCKTCELGAQPEERFCPHMSDGGRMFTDFRPRCNKITNQGMSSYDMRMHLINNADKLINADRADLHTRLGCAPCFCYEQPGTVPPNQSELVCNNRTCALKMTNPCGVGTGRSNTSLNVKFDAGFMEVPLYPINGFPDGIYSQASKYIMADVSQR